MIENFHFSPSLTAQDTGLIVELTTEKVSLERLWIVYPLPAQVDCRIKKTEWEQTHILIFIFFPVFGKNPIIV